MDILWAISNPLASQTLSSEPTAESYDDPYAPLPTPRKSLGALRRQSSSFMPGGSGSFPSSPTTTTYADGSWEMYEDFVGGVQFWGYALASGTGDGCVRMWDSAFVYLEAIGEGADGFPCSADWTGASHARGAYGSCHVCSV